MRIIFIVITALLLVPEMISWHFQDIPMLIALAGIQAMVMISAVFMRGESWAI